MQKAEKQLEIIARYKAELAVFEAETLNHILKNTFYTRTSLPVIFLPIDITFNFKSKFSKNLLQIFSVKSERFLLQYFVACHFILSEPDFSFFLMIFQHLSSSVFHQSGQNKKLTKKTKSQKKQIIKYKEIFEYNIIITGLIDDK